MNTFLSLSSQSSVTGLEGMLVMYTIRTAQCCITIYKLEANCVYFIYCYILSEIRYISIL